MIKKIIFSILLLPGFIFAFSHKSDFEYYKEIFGISDQGVYYFDIDADIESHSKKYLNDVRIFNQEDKEIKYIKKQESDSYAKSEKIINLNYKSIGEMEYLVDLGNDTKNEYLNTISLRTNSTGFRTVVDVYGADIEEGPYFKLNLEGERGDLIYSTPTGHDFDINFKYSNYKFLKLVFSGYNDDFKIEGFYRTKYDNILKEGEKNILKVFGVNKFIDENHQSIILDVKKDNLFFDTLILKFNDNEFNRNYVIYGANDKNAEMIDEVKRYDKNKNYWIKINSGNLTKDEYSGDPELRLGTNYRYYRIDIDNGDNENLDFESGVFEKFKTRLYFIAEKNNNYSVYYGSAKINRPRYDFKLDSIEIAKAKKVNLGIEKKNKLFLEKKENILLSQWEIYGIIFVVLLILIFFIYKVLKETKNKTAKDEIQI